jgi:D-amino peptidase
MYKRVLLLTDLEGVNNVVGEPYQGLSKDSEQWHVARKQIALELNAAAEALFAAGVERIGVWDGHGGGNNIDPADLDPRLHLFYLQPNRTFQDVVDAHSGYDCVAFFGYHTMEGTLGGVLAHTMNSKVMQYYKVNGKYVGEVDLDAAIAAEFDLPACFYAGGDLSCKQAARAIPGIVTVVTKTELSRNKAIFRDNEELFADIKEKIVAAMHIDQKPYKLTYPLTMEKSFKRVEDAAIFLEGLQAAGVSCDYLDDEILGKDAHTVVSQANNIETFIKCIRGK